MGRKIPGKKHRGVKDPAKQQAKRHAELKNRINAPPKDVDEQPIPRSLERLVKLKEAVKSGKITKTNKRRRTKNRLICIGNEDSTNLHPKAKPDKVVPIFQQKPGEAPERFFYRVSRETEAFINETAFEKKYGVQVNRNPETGQVRGVSKAPKDELEEIEKLRAKHKNIKKKKKKVGDMPKMSKAQKRKEKLRLKKQKKEEEEQDDFQDFRDEVKFGEVAHAPPQLQARPKQADTTSSAKPGKKELLLHSLLKQNSNTNHSASAKVTEIDRSGKRKNLPVGERRQLEKQQSEVIAAYRRLKAQQIAAAQS